jgi:aminoglycoside 6'-N-acetyltransferase
MSIGKPLQGERLTVRDMEPADVEPIRAIRNEPEIVKWWGKGDRWPGSVTDGEELLAIDVDGELAGYIEIFEEDEDPDWRFASLDIFVCSALIGKGFGTEALCLVIDFLAAERKHHRITIDPSVDNEIAVASYKKAGFETVGVMKKYWRDGEGNWRDSLLMELIIESNL